MIKIKVLFATTNPAKARYYVEKLLKRGIDLITLNDLDIHINVEENGKTPIENAIIKAKAYNNTTKLVTIAVDDGLFIEGLEDEKQPGTNVRRINGKRLSDNEMIKYYTSLVEGLGGQAYGNWIHGIAICDNEQNVYTYQTKSTSIFTNKASNIIKEGYPLESISIVPHRNKYRSELTKEELEQERDLAGKENFDFIINCLNK